MVGPRRARWRRCTASTRSGSPGCETPSPRHFGRTPRAGEGPLDGLELLDIGCGAGLLSEPLSRLGARVTGLDPAPSSIEIARAHAEATGAPSGLSRRARSRTSPAKARSSTSCSRWRSSNTSTTSPASSPPRPRWSRPGGLIALSTLNRTLKSFALAIVGAEYVLRWVPAGTHRWEQFVTPDELSAALRAAGLKASAPRGIDNPLRREWTLSSDSAVNYFMSATVERSAEGG